MLDEGKLKAMFETLGDDAPEIKVISDPEELWAILREGMSKDESLESGAAEKVALNMNSKTAGIYATGALLGAANEFNSGHDNCARFKMEASALWLAIAEFFERVEEREAKAVAFQQTLDDAKAKRAEQLREDAVSGSAE